MSLLKVGKKRNVPNLQLFQEYLKEKVMVIVKVCRNKYCNSCLICQALIRVLHYEIIGESKYY